MPRPAAKNYLQEAIKKYSPGPRVLDVGAGEDPNYYEDLFPDQFFDKLDLVQNRAGTIKWVSDICSLDVATTQTYDLVICMEVLEHIPNLRRAVEVCRYYANAGGLLVFTTVACWGIHGHPKDYWRILPDGMRYLLELAGLEILDISLERPETTQPCGVFATARRP